MKNDQIALYLNDHPEFFNQYPELLARIQSIEPEDMPLRPVKTLNITERIVKRAQADKEHMKNQLVSFMAAWLGWQACCRNHQLCRCCDTSLALQTSVFAFSFSATRFLSQLA